MYRAVPFVSSARACTGLTRHLAVAEKRDVIGGGPLPAERFRRVCHQSERCERLHGHNGERRRLGRAGRCHSDNHSDYPKTSCLFKMVDGEDLENVARSSQRRGCSTQCFKHPTPARPFLGNREREWPHPATIPFV